MSNTTNTSTHQVYIWDLPTRLFHWLFVVAFTLAWFSQGDDRYLDIHVFSGYLFLGLLLFRFLWGFFGSHYARFCHFTFGWQAVWHYLKTLLTPQCQHFLGHNPAGSWAVFFILTLSLIVSVTGLLTLGGEEQHGLFAGIIGFALGNAFHWWHNVIAWLMLGFISIHILGVFIESGLHHENLVKAMITGSKTAPTQSININIPQNGLSAIALILTVIAGTLSYFQGYFQQEQPYLPFVGAELPDNALWQEACGECHLAYHPALLPARSWQRMLMEQNAHFEEDLDLEEETLTTLHTFAVENAAESMLTEAAWNISHSTPPEQSPRRITKTPYWIEQHQSINNKIWQHPEINFQGNCGACHLDAEQGTFEDAAMQLPDFVKAKR